MYHPEITAHLSTFSYLRLLTHALESKLRLANRPASIS
jgi:hypothetical protein